MVGTSLFSKLNTRAFPSYIRHRKCSVTVCGAKSGQNEFLQKFDCDHIKTTSFQKTLLGFGSAVMSLADPRRGDMIATMGETTGTSSLKYVYSKMQQSNEGSRILQNKPRITSATIDINWLESLPDGTVGKAYSKFLKKYNYTPDARLAVRFVDDIELAYVIQRYREVHDLFHTILSMPTNMLGEVTVKWVEAIQTRLPMCIGGALFGAARLSPNFRQRRHFSTKRKPQVAFDETVKDDLVTRKHPGVCKVNCVALPSQIKSALLKIIEEKNIPNFVDNVVAVRNYLRNRKPQAEEMQYSNLKKICVEEVKKQISMKHMTSSGEEDEYIRKMLISKSNALIKSRLYHWKPLVMSGNFMYEYMVARSPAEYAALYRIFSEISARNPRFAPNHLFDFGSGLGTVTWAAHSFWKESIKEYFTVDVSPEVNDLARLILCDNSPTKEPFIPYLFQRQFLPATPRKYDLVISAFSLMELDSMRSRMNIISNLWSKTNQYLVVVEQGTNAGFQIVEEVRDFVLHLEKNSENSCHVFAPCPHNFQCPRKMKDNTPCNYKVNYFPLLCGKDKQSESEVFSYIVIKRGSRSEQDDWPRLVRDVLPRHKHVVCKLCTSEGALEEVTFTASKQGKDVYKCARRSTWGDRLPMKLSFENSS